MKKTQDSRIPVYKSVSCNNVIKHIEIEHFVSVFQELFNIGEIKRVYYNETGKIVALENDGGEMPDII